MWNSILTRRYHQHDLLHANITLLINTQVCQFFPLPLGIKWYHHVRNDDVRRKTRATTSFGYCSSMASLPVRPHCMNVRRIRCQADLNSFPLGELEETTGMPPYHVDEDYPAGPEINEPLPERSNWRGSESPTLEIDVYIWRNSLVMVHARNEWMNEWPLLTHTVMRCHLEKPAIEYTSSIDSIRHSLCLHS